MTTEAQGLTALVLGGYGLIGAEIARSLREAGFRVIGLGRSATAGASLFPPERWITADMAQLRRPDQWAPHLRGVDVVVNAAGALQDGPEDRLQAIHADAVAALVRACEEAGVARLVQISAPGAEPDASTAFLRTKAEGDEAIRGSRLGWTILRPGVVIGARAYGGSALLRMLASQPGALALVAPKARLQTVSLDEVAEAARLAATGALPPGTDVALVEEQGRSLEEAALTVRRWLGWPAPCAVLRLPDRVGDALAWLGDRIQGLGWRSTVTSTALTALREGVHADPRPWRALRGGPLQSLEQTLAAIPTGVAERRAARLALLKPAIIGLLSLFWILTGVIVLANFQASLAVLAPSSLSPGLAQSLVFLGAVLDIALGAMALMRRTAAWAFRGMILTTLAYLILGTILTPALWLDPMGSLLKAFPVLALSAAALVLLEER